MPEATGSTSPVRSLSWLKALTSRCGADEIDEELNGISAPGHAEKENNKGGD